MIRQAVSSWVSYLAYVVKSRPGRGVRRQSARVRPAVEALEDRNVPSIVVVSDFNGDGVGDLVVQGRVLLGHGDGTFEGSPVAFADAGQAVGDFNGDGAK